MPAWVLPAAIGATAVGGFLGQLFGNKSRKDVAQRSFENDFAMMKWQADYNSPVNQMARLRQAGLNSNLVYGGGNATGNLTGQTPKYQEQPQEWNFDSIAMTAGSMLDKYIDYEVKNKQVDKMQAEINAVNQKAANDAIMNDILATKNLQQAFQFDEYKKIAPYQLELKKELATKASQDAINAVKTGELRDSELKNKAYQRSLIAAQIANQMVDAETKRKLLEDLNKGVWTNAPWFVRVAQRISTELGLSMDKMEEIWIAPGLKLKKPKRNSWSQKGFHKGTY